MISYRPMFETMKRKGVGLIDIQNSLGISSKVTAKFRKNERVSLETIERICILLDVPIEDVVEVVRQK